MAGSVYSLVVSQAHDAAVVLKPATVVLHARVHDRPDWFINVVRADILQKVDHLSPRRLQTHIHDFNKLYGLGNSYS